jgi:uncharacterized membrane protein
MSEKSDHRNARVYLTTVVLLLAVLPAGCVLIEASRGARDLPILIGKWFVFWGVGVRLFLAGLRQIFQPAFTAATIFEITEIGAQAIVRELGFANVAMGTLGLASLAGGAWLAPSALVGGLYYGLAGIGHVARQRRNVIEQTALISDLLIFALLALFLASRAFR